MLPLQTFTALVQQFAASAQSAATALLDFTVGSVLRAVAEANASVALWMQWLIMLVMSKIRAATCVGPDLDTWMADFGLTRLPAVAATGAVTFSRFSPSTSALVPVGAQVKTADGTQSFAVIADTTQPTWNAGMAGYLIPAATASASVTVQAVTPGTGGNVQIGAISLLASAIPGVDTVNNAAAVTTGINAEADAAFLARFQNYINTRARATLAAIAYAIQSVQQGLTWTIAENTNTAAGYQPGNFLVTVDDGSGSPPSSLITACGVAIAAYRPIGSTWTTQGPTVETANVALTITTNPAGNKPGLLTPVQAAVDAYINALPNGAGLPYSRIPLVAYGVDPSITNVSSYTLNSGTADLAAVSGQSIRAGTVTVS